MSQMPPLKLALPKPTALPVDGTPRPGAPLRAAAAEPSADAGISTPREGMGDFFQLQQKAVSGELPGAAADVEASVESSAGFREGWIWKKGRAVKSWKRRWAMVRAGVLCY